MNGPRHHPASNLPLLMLRLLSVTVAAEAQVSEAVVVEALEEGFVAQGAVEVAVVVPYHRLQYWSRWHHQSDRSQLGLMIMILMHHLLAAAVRMNRATTIARGHPSSTLALQKLSLLSSYFAAIFRTHTAEWCHTLSH